MPLARALVEDREGHAGRAKARREHPVVVVDRAAVEDLDEEGHALFVERLEHVRLQVEVDLTLRELERGPQVRVRGGDDGRRRAADDADQHRQGRHQRDCPSATSAPRGCGADCHNPHSGYRYAALGASIFVRLGSWGPGPSGSWRGRDPDGLLDRASPLGEPVDRPDPRGARHHDPHHRLRSHLYPDRP